MQSTVEEMVQAAEALATEVAAEVLSGTKRPAPGAPENRPAQGPSQVAKPRTEEMDNDGGADLFAELVEEDVEEDEEEESHVVHTRKRLVEGADTRAPYPEPCS